MIIDLYNLINSNLPTMLQGNVLRRFLRALLEPLRTLNLRAFVELGYTAQTSSMELYLNTLYGIPYNPNTRAADILSGTIIYIEHWSSVLPPQYLYNNSESQPPVYVYNTVEGEPPLYLYNTQEFTGNWDFRVNIPTATAYNLNQLRAQINKYRPLGRRYVIQTY